YEYLVLARLMIAQGRADQALTILEPLTARMQQRGRMRLVIEALMLQALAFQKKSDTDQALAALEHVLTLAEPEGFVRLFVDEGVVMEFLISDLRFRIERRLRGANDTKLRRLLSYSNRLLATFKSPQIGTPKSEIINHKSEILPEPLSAREKQVLQLLADGLSNKAIARKLVVADETVKKHLKNIYGKLGAHSRTEALARARELELL
ncbi:partial HTH-type transcriptional regulator MalT, partial [Anaerolineae bacterium]